MGRNQVLRAQSAIMRQNANLASAKAEVKSSEAKLRAAIAAPQLLDRSAGALIPGTPTADWPNSISLESELSSALQFHPHVQALSTNLKAARVRLKVAENELKPTLDLVLEGYLRGLNGDYDLAKSLGDQFSKGAPNYSAGLSFSRPYRNVAAQAILRERRLLIKQVLMELDNTLLTIGANVEGAVAKVEAAFTELEAVVQATLATHAEVQYLAAKWQDAFLDGGQTNLVVEQLLNAEIQLIQAENAWARAQQITCSP